MNIIHQTAYPLHDNIICLKWIFYFKKEIVNHHLINLKILLNHVSHSPEKLFWISTIFFINELNIEKNDCY